MTDKIQSGDDAQGTRGNLSDDIEYAIRLAREDRANNAIEYLIWMGRKYAQPPAAPAAQPTLLSVIEAEARRIAGMYPQSSDGQNTFVIFADWISNLAAQPPAAPVEPEAWTRQKVENYFQDWQFWDTVAPDTQSHVVDDVTRMIRSKPPAAPVDLINRLRSMPSSLNDALRTMEEAADLLAGAPAAPVEGKTLAGAVAEIRALAANGPMPAAPVETPQSVYEAIIAGIGAADVALDQAAEIVAALGRNGYTITLFAAPVETDADLPTAQDVRGILLPDWKQDQADTSVLPRAKDAQVDTTDGYWSDPKTYECAPAHQIDVKNLAIEVARERIAELINERDAALAQVAALQCSSAGSANDFERPFQNRVLEWLMACFSMEVCRDGVERNHRFLEEALELVQALGCTRSEAHQLVDYVFDRPAGEPMQELGGVMVTLAALCFPHDLNMNEAAERELARVWTKIDKIRAKQAAKPKHSPLPQHVTNEPQSSSMRTVLEDVSNWLEGCLQCKTWSWDGLQRDAAESALKEARAALALSRPQEK